MNQMSPSECQDVLDKLPQKEKCLFTENECECQIHLVLVQLCPKHLQVATQANAGDSPLLPVLAPAFQQLVVPSSQQPRVFPLRRCCHACSFLDP